MNQRYPRFWLFWAILPLSLSAVSVPASAEESDVSDAPPRAVWISPSAARAPWLDARPNQPEMASPKIEAVGRDIALMRTADGRMMAADAQLNELGYIWTPESVHWIGVDGQNRILVYDGNRLKLSVSYKDAENESGFRDIMMLPDTRFIDCGFSALAYIDNQKLTIADLDSGNSREIVLSDFFADEKVARMTPESIEEYEAIKNSKNKKAIKAAEAQIAAADAAAAESARHPFEVAGLWVRPDNAVVVRVRRLLNERTFVSTDAGKSWRQLQNTPSNLIHQGGWIWDGREWVLSNDAQQFVQVKGQNVYLPNRWLMTHTPEMRSILPEQWMHQENPSAPTDAEQAIVDVGTIPVWTPSESHDLYPPYEGVYQPELQRTGIRMGFYSDAACPGQIETCQEDLRTPPTAFQIVPDKKPEPLKLPESCEPLFLDSDRGLGVLICDAFDGEVGIFVKTADSDWALETRMPVEIAKNSQLISADDGTIAVMGKCYEEIIPASDASDESVQMPETSVWTCPIAIRSPEAVAQPDVWRLERLRNVNTVTIIPDARLLAIQSDAPDEAFQQMTLLTAGSNEVLVDRFDSSPYQGLVVTDDGCLALWDGTVSPETLKKSNPETRLLSVSGGFAGMDCETSKAIREAEIAKAAEEEDAPTGDPRYGLRVGAAGFFASGDVQTWALRVEGLIPLYGGQYEVGLLYRMAGGNTSSALGHLGIVSVRWRYDGFEKFDFAVGAGLGYGSMCGYERKQKDEEEKDEEEEETDDRKKGYEACSTLSMRYMVSAIATYKFAKQWKLYIAAELLGGSEWGLDVGGGIEVRF